MKKWLAIITAIVAVLLVCMSLASCSEDDPLGDIPNYGLEFEFHELDGQAWYSVKGIGSCVDEHIVIPSTYNGFDVLGIESNAFKDNKNIKSVVIPDSVNNISYSAFENCSFLEKIDIGDGVVYLQDKAFAGCVRVKELKIGKSLKHINYNDAIRAFEGCASRLESIYVSPENEYYECINNCLFDKDDGILILGCKNSNLSTTPDYVGSIGATAFKGCIGLESIEIPASVMLVGMEAFAECPDLKTVTVNASNPFQINFDTKAFQNCPKLTSVDCSKTNGFSDQCFDQCTALAEVRIPINVNYIGFMSFDSNTKVIYEGSSYEWEGINLHNWWRFDEAPQVTFENNTVSGDDNSSNENEYQIYELWVSDELQLTIELRESEYRTVSYTDDYTEDGTYRIEGDMIYLTPYGGEEYSFTFSYTDNGILLDDIPLIEKQ